MANNIVMASSKILATTKPSPSPLFTPKAQQHHLPQISIIPSTPKQPININNRFQKVLQSLKSTATIAAVAAATAATASPVLAKEMEKAALFDFNLTLPAIAAEFLLLMVALDKIYFTPLGKFMDERDAAIREKLNSFKDTSEEVKELEEQAAAVLKAARAEISAALNQMKKETTQEVEQQLAEGRKKVEAELAEALQILERQKEETMKSLDSQIAALSDGIVKKVLPI